MAESWKTPERLAIMRVKDKFSFRVAKDLVRSFGVEKLNDLPKERHAEFIAKCDDVCKGKADVERVLPKKLEKWQHHNGVIYTVDCLANTESDNRDYPITVVYIGPNGHRWAKPLDNFLMKMKKVSE